MEIPTMEDFIRLERSVNGQLQEIKEMLSDQCVRPLLSGVLSVKNVEEEFKVSAHIQRQARQQGRLVFKKIGKEVQYNRVDVETWVNSTIVKY